MITASDCGLLKLIKGDTPFKQTAVVPAIVAVGTGRTVMVAVPLIILEQTGVL